MVSKLPCGNSHGPICDGGLGPLMCFMTMAKPLVPGRLDLEGPDPLDIIVQTEDPLRYSRAKLADLPSDEPLAELCFPFATLSIAALSDEPSRDDVGARDPDSGDRGGARPSRGGSGAGHGDGTPRSGGSTGKSLGSRTPGGRVRFSIPGSVDAESPGGAEGEKRFAAVVGQEKAANWAANRWKAGALRPRHGSDSSRYLVDTPFANALRCGRIMEQHRLLELRDESRALDARKSVVANFKGEEGALNARKSVVSNFRDEEGSERDEKLEGMIRRIGDRFKVSLNELQPRWDEDWRVEKDHTYGQEYWYRVVRDDWLSRTSTHCVQMWAAMEIRDSDPIQGLVALCEHDFVQRYHAQVAEARELRWRSGDGVWRVVRQTDRGKEDSVVHVSAVDALDEELGALWVAMYTPAEEGMGDILGTTVPPPATGTVRIGLWHSTFTILPDWEGGASSFRLTFASTVRTYKAAFMYPSVIGNLVGKILGGYRDFLSSGTDMAWRALFSNKAPFYDEIRRRLHERLEAAPSRKARATRQAGPQLSISWQELSAHVPPDWAD